MESSKPTPKRIRKPRTLVRALNRFLRQEDWAAGMQYVAEILPEESTREVTYAKLRFVLHFALLCRVEPAFIPVQRMLIDDLKDEILKTSKWFEAALTYYFERFDAFQLLELSRAYRRAFPESASAQSWCNSADILFSHPETPIDFAERVRFFWHRFSLFEAKIREVFETNAHARDYDFDGFVESFAFLLPAFTFHIDRPLDPKKSARIEVACRFPEHFEELLYFVNRAPRRLKRFWQIEPGTVRDPDFVLERGAQEIRAEDVEVWPAIDAQGAVTLTLRSRKIEDVVAGEPEAAAEIVRTLCLRTMGEALFTCGVRKLHLTDDPPERPGMPLSDIVSWYEKEAPQYLKATIRSLSRSAVEFTRLRAAPAVEKIGDWTARTDVLSGKTALPALVNMWELSRSPEELRARGELSWYFEHGIVPATIFGWYPPGTPKRVMRADARRVVDWVNRRSKELGAPIGHAGGILFGEQTFYVDALFWTSLPQSFVIELPLALQAAYTGFQVAHAAADTIVFARRPEDAGDDWKPLRLLRRPGNPVDTGAWPPPMISMLERIRDGLLAVPENGEKADAQAAVTEWVDAEGFLGHA